MTGRKNCRVEKLHSKPPAPLYLSGGLGEVCLSVTLGGTQRLFSPLPAGQRDTFQDILRAPAGHLQPLQLVPQVVPNQCQGLICSRGSLEGTCKPHLGKATPAVLLYELHCSETQRDTQRSASSSFVNGNTAPDPRLLSLFLSALEHQQGCGI